MKRLFAYSVNSLTTIALFALTVAGVTNTYAADPQPYEVTIAKTGNGELDQMLADVCTLTSLKDIAPVGSFALVARARSDVARFITALQSLGYYQGTVEVRIAKRPLDDRGLYDTIDYSPASPPIPVEISVTPGGMFHIGTITIAGEAPKDAIAWLGLKEKIPARAAQIQQAGDKLLLALQDHGYALAKVDEPIGELHTENHEVDVTYPVITGQTVNLGKITVQGLQKVNPTFVERRLKIASGQPFKLSSIEKNRQDLQATGVFSSVRARLGEGLDARKLDSKQHIPVTFIVNERLRHTVHLGAAYSTDLGGSFSNYWQHHNLLGYGEQLNLTGGITQIGGNSTTDIGYNLAANFTKPDFLQQGQALQVDLVNVRQSLRTYNQDAIFALFQLTRRLNPKWTGSLGVGPERSTITQAGETHDYTLLSVPASLKYDSTNNLLDPIRGSMAQFLLTPIESVTAGDFHTFVIMQAIASTYLDFGSEGRSVMALRGMLGNIEGAGRFDLPPDKRFYAGGSPTVRGYRYQSIGPVFADGNPQGGKALATATIEFRQRIFENYGIVAFSDAGQVSPDTLLGSGDWRIGAGIGARYYTSFGPLRLDAAFPINKQDNSGSFEIYLGLGQAF